MDTANEKSINGHVILSGICPRTDNSGAASKGTVVNEALKTPANEKDCVFIDHSDSFLTRGGEIIEDFLLMDALHLSTAGTRKLLKKINISQYATVKLDMPRTKPAWQRTSSLDPGRFQHRSTPARRDSTSRCQSGICASHGHPAPRLQTPRHSKTIPRKKCRLELLFLVWRRQSYYQELQTPRTNNLSPIRPFTDARASRPFWLPALWACWLLC